MTGGRQALGRLAAELGVQRAYTDIAGRRRTASAAALAAVCTALGWEAAEDGRGADDALRALRAGRAASLADPVAVIRDGASPAIGVRPQGGGALEWLLQREDGRQLSGTASALDLVYREGGSWWMPLPGPLPVGRHLLTLEQGRRAQEVHLLCAPRAAVAPDDRGWGLFLPLYALPGRWGIGDMTELRRLVEWSGERGAAMVGSTPIFAGFLDRPFDPSPYAPVSRLFWNEVYLDPAAAPELERSAAARELLGSPGYQEALARLRAAPLVDQGGAMAAKRQLLEALLHAVAGERRAKLESLRAEQPHLDAYARFRARCEAAGGGWPAWADGDRPSDDAAEYHAYVQMLCAEQLEAAGSAHALYLDMPLGVHPDGFDTWRFADSFVDGLSVGAPPDELFAGGQDWGFRPLHPERTRQDGHRYLQASLDALLGRAATVRIDHVMGLHRLYCVPFGMGAKEGVYVRQPAEELYALLAIESHRHGTVLVGEDLGTVPGEVRTAMRRRGLLRSFVLQLELQPDADPFAEVPRDALAGTNTHDMPTFAGFWEGEDIERRLRIGLVGAADAERERELRSALRAALTRSLDRRGHAADSERDAYRAALLELAASAAQLLVVNLEDMWGEAEPQNLPGTSLEQPNWRRRARYGVDQLDDVPGLAASLAAIAGARGRAA